MTALLAPTRIRTTNDDDHDDQQAGENGTIIDYDYLRSLVVGGKKAGPGRGKQRQRVFCVSLPEIASVPRSLGGGYRSLTEPAAELEKSMAANEAGDEDVSVSETAPSSPSELSYSKSSTSSIRSDSLSDEGSTDKLSHFEEVTLEGEERVGVEDCNVKPEARPTLKRVHPRSSTPSDFRKNAAPLPNSRLRDGRYPSLQGAVNGVLRDQSLNLPIGLRRNYTSPPSPSSMMHVSERLPSRSPSPGKSLAQTGYHASPQSVGSLTPRASWDARTIQNGQLPRRQSWRPGRKTVKELEAEYNDADEDVPDEAILENVPISPMPGQSHSKPPSPQRRPSQPHLALHTNLHSAKVPKNAKRPSAPTVMPNGQYGSPRSPRHRRPPMIPHSATVASFTPEPFGHKHRSKSWTEDLNHEARELSVALEEYADRLSSEKLRSGTSSLASSPPRPSLAKARTKTTILDLPPVQKGSIMIDPLPISKEKEAVLSRTRPSWLPPKSQKEEKKHVKEWEHMMARAADAEKKRAVKLKEQAEDKEEQQESIARIWDEHVLHDWDNAIKDPRTRELWWRGVNSRSRGIVWQRAIGNELGLQPTSFEAALRRANELEEKVAEMPDEERNESKEAAWLDAIERDVPHIYPELQMFQRGAPLHYALADILKAYAMYRSDVGYVYGTHLVAGVLCMHLPPNEAFVVLANMLNRPLPLAFLVHDQAGMARAYEMVLSTLKYKFTKLHSHLTSPATNVMPEEYLDPMFRCLFAYNLPQEHVNRIWDIFVFDGDKALVRAAVAALGRLEGKLYGSREEILDLISWSNEKEWDLGNEDDFIKAVREAGKVDGNGEVQSQ